MSKRYTDLLLYESDALAQNTCNHYKSRFLLDHDCTGEIEKDTFPLSQKCHNLFTSFTGKERDSETGFSYYGARYYDPDVSALFLSVDPRADKYPGISPYAYCAWNPVKLVDPDGNDWYEYTDEKTNEKKIRWTDCHNQDELNKKHNNATYLGVTVDDGKTYYGLMGDKVDKTNEGGRYRLVKDLDRAIINRALASSAFASTPVDFSDVFAFKSGAGSNTQGQGIRMQEEWPE